MAGGKSADRIVSNRPNVVFLWVAPQPPCHYLKDPLYAMSKSLRGLRAPQDIQFTYTHLESYKRVPVFTISNLSSTVHRQYAIDHFRNLSRIWHFPDFESFMKMPPLCMILNISRTCHFSVFWIFQDYMFIHDLNLSRIYHAPLFLTISSWQCTFKFLSDLGLFSYKKAFPF